jgi:hypothetical protein
LTTAELKNTADVLCASQGVDSPDWVTIGRWRSKMLEFHNEISEDILREYLEFKYGILFGSGKEIKYSLKECVERAKTMGVSISRYRVKNLAESYGFLYSWEFGFFVFKNDFEKMITSEFGENSGS